MKKLAGVLLIAIGAIAATRAPDERARALHVLNRLTWGPRPGDVDRVVAMGVDQFIAQQLKPEAIPDRTLDQRLKSYEILKTSTRELAAGVREAQQQRQQQQRAAGGDSARMMDPEMRRGQAAGQPDNAVRRLIGEYMNLTLVRHVTSERQLNEVMVDFWTNHFNIFIGKGADRFLLPGYIEETIRPRVFGKFEDLLLATAQSPAMLFYLDNAQSVAPGSKPPQLERLEAIRARGGVVRPRARQGVNPQRMDSMMTQLESRMPKGINENYAREVMELHTLGVDGGYTQQDVENLARILTGWGILQTRQDPKFVFNDWAHDRGAKTVLGRRFPAGKGMDEGVEALKMLARNPATMRHLSAKLCARFVSDDVSDGCIDAGVHAWERTDGDIREVVQAIITSKEFWDPANRASKLKTPLEFVASALRAVGAQIDQTPAAAAIVARLGQPLFGQQPPTGYPETQESWVNSGALLQRMNVALGLAAGKLPGVTADVDGIVPAGTNVDQMIATVNAKLLSGTASENTLKTMRNQVADLPDAATKRAMIVGLALGGPEFQKQ